MNRERALRPLSGSRISRERLRSYIGSTGFQPVRRTGKMPVPPKTFQNILFWALGPPVNYEKFIPVLALDFER